VPGDTFMARPEPIPDQRVAKLIIGSAIVNSSRIVAAHTMVGG